MAAYWEMTAHSAYDMFPYCEFRFFPTSEWEFLSDYAISLLLPTSTLL